MLTIFEPGKIGFPAAILALMFLIQAVDWITPFYDLTRWGVQAWSIWHIPGIVLHPLLHTDWGHLLANALPFVVLGTILSLKGEFMRLSILGTVIIGSILWLLPLQGGIHVGASALILCFFGFISIRGFRTRAWQDLLLALAVLLFYGVSMWATVVNFSAGISWQGHLVGLSVGLALGWNLDKPTRQV